MSELRRVGLNLLYLVPGETGGTAVYAQHLIPGLAAARPDLELVAFVNREGADLELDGAELVRLQVSGRRKYRRSLAEQGLMPKLTREHGIDLLHSPGAWAPIRLRAVSVVTVHDVIYTQFPETQVRRARMRWRMLVPPAARSAERVITPSNASAASVTDALTIPRDRIDVIHNAGKALGPATPERELRERLALGDARIVLCVSPRRAHKNTARLFAALARSESTPSTILVMTGKPTPFDGSLDEEAARLGVAERIRCPGWVSDEDLEGLYQAATCLVFPSLIEGFGIPVVEAMERGVPVACSNAPSLPEVAGDAARYFDPLDVGDIAAAIDELVGDAVLRENLAGAGRKRARLFSWEQAARQTAESYERAWATRPTLRA